MLTIKLIVSLTSLLYAIACSVVVVVVVRSGQS